MNRTPSSLESHVGAYEKERLKRLSEQPNTTVFRAEFEATNEPWAASRLREVSERIAKQVTDLDDSYSDFRVRKLCLADNEVLRFQRQHPKLFWMLSDRKMVRDTRFQKALGAMFTIRERVEQGEVADGHDADAIATSSIVAALQS